MRLRDLSLATRPLVLLLWSGALVLLALLATVTLLQQRGERERAEAGAIRENQNRAIAYEQFVARTFEAAEFAAVHLGPHYRGAFPAGAAPRRIADPVTAHPLFAGVVIADAEGDIGWSSFSGSPTRNIAGQPAFRALRAGTERRALFIGDPFYSKEHRRTLIPLSHAIRNADGSFAGIVAIFVPVGALTDFNRGAQLRPLDIFSVIRLDGIGLAQRAGDRFTSGTDLRGKLAMQRQYADPNGTYLGPAVLDGIPRYFSHRRLDRYGVFVSAGVAQQDALREVRAHAHWHWGALALLALAITGFATALSWGMRRRDRAVHALTESHARLGEAQRLGRIGNWEFDPATQQLIWSEQLCEMVGRDPADNVLSRDEGLAYLEPAGRAELLAMIESVEATHAARECEVIARDDAGREVFHRIRVSPRVRANGEVCGLFATVQDITTEKHHERLRDEIAQIARVESMNMVGATAVHELSQPLTAASNYVAAALALAQRQAPGDAALVVERLEEAGRHIGFTRNIVQRVRDMVTDRTDVAPGASVADIVEDAVALVWLAAPGWQSEIAQQLWVAEAHVAADQIQVQQVLLNLLRNACQAAAGAEVPRVAVSSSAYGEGQVMFCVADNGPGIDPDLGDIFSPFASSKRDGLGLGLAVSRAIVQSYGGRMWVDTEHSPGARICFTLPLEG